MKKKIMITIEAKDVTKKMYLRNSLATGKTGDGRDINITSVIPDGSLHYKIGDKSYLISMQDILKAILKELGTS